MMHHSIVAILGSSRKDGATKSLADTLITMANIDIIDLNDFSISYYNYEQVYVADDYLDLMKKLILQYDTFLFVTPVYWYSMSGIMKVFFDRITDLLDSHKELGRALRGKKMAVLTTSNGNHLGDKFWYPFIETAQYLGIDYLGHLHTIHNNIDPQELNKFISQISNRSKDSSH
jgi:multimeric flavodoxin WrbA